MELPRKLSAVDLPILLLGFALAALGCAAAWYIHSLGLTLMLGDARANIVTSRFVLDSITPGLNQVGFWNMLLHVLMSVPATVPILFHTGFAGAVTILPFFIAGGLFLFAAAHRLTGSRAIALFAVSLFALNPYVLYFLSVPMSETLFASNVMIAVYFLSRWFEREDLRSLIWMGIFISVASVTRYEGLMLAPIALVIVGMWQWRKFHNVKQLEAVLLVFGSLAFIGLGAILLYNLSFGGSAFFFLSQALRPLSKEAAALSLWTQFLQAWEPVSHATYFLLSQTLVWASALAALVAVLISRFRLRNASLLLLAFGPFLFAFLAVASKRYTLAVPGYPANNHVFNNERYALNLLSFMVLAPTLLLGALRERLWSREGVRVPALFFAVCIGVALEAQSLWFSYSIFRQDFPIVRNNIMTSKATGNSMSSLLDAQYDFGKVLTKRYGNDDVFLYSHLPFSSFIWEGNFRYYQSALDVPWIYARWLVVADIHQVAERRLPLNPDFEKYYTLVGGDGARLYKVDEERVRAYVRSRGWPENIIPSINNIQWDQRALDEQLYPAKSS